MQVGVIGLGKLGLPLALCLAEAGYQVSGYDRNLRLINSLLEGEFFTHEPIVMDLLNDPHIRKNMDFSNTSSSLSECNIIYIIVPTPSNAIGIFDSSHVEQAIQDLLQDWREIEEGRSIVIVSTVMPGTCQTISERYLRGKKAKLIYSPEFIALGTVIDNLRNPDAILVGCAEKIDSEIHVKVQKEMSGEIPVSLLSWEEAEVVKLLVNCYVTMKISFANFVGEICDVLPGANPKNIASALGLDSRIGGRYLNPGLGYAGPCFPRDNKALSAWSLERGLQADLALATQAINIRQPKMAVNRIIQILSQESSVLIIGLVYKPRTEVLEHSQSLELAFGLKAKGYSVSIFDPFVAERDRKNLESDFQFVSSLSESKVFELVVLSPGFESFVSELDPSQKIYRF